VHVNIFIEKIGSKPRKICLKTYGLYDLRVWAGQETNCYFLMFFKVFIFGNWVHSVLILNLLTDFRDSLDVFLFSHFNKKTSFFNKNTSFFNKNFTILIAYVTNISTTYFLLNIFY